MDAFLHKNRTGMSAAARYFSDLYHRDNPVVYARRKRGMERTNNQRVKNINKWSNSFAGKSYRRKLSRFNATHSAKESLNTYIMEALRSLEGYKVSENHIVDAVTDIVNYRTPVSTTAVIETILGTPALLDCMASIIDG